MSDYEQHSGKLKLVPAADGETLEQLCRRLILQEDRTTGVNSTNESDNEQLEDYYGDKYVILNGNVYEYIEKVEEDETDDFTRIKENPDGTFNFNTRFYNGGTWLKEMLEVGMKKLLKDKANDTN